MTFDIINEPEDGKLVITRYNLVFYLIAINSPFF